ncbi:MAG: TIGR01621 family pseudouridine synthase [Halopseudomonas sp.]
MPTPFKLIDVQPGFVVICKAPGVAFHSEAGQPGLVPQVESELGLGKLFPVHRLDNMTSGLLLLARDAKSAEQINQQFRQRRVEKYYLALSDRKPSKKQGLVCGDMVKGRRGSWKLLKTQENPAKTRFFCYSLSPGIRLFVLKPQTGRTHQLRVMMKSLGAPILGDQRYYPDCAEGQQDRGYLHAYMLMFEIDGKAYRYLAEPEHGRLFINELVKQKLVQIGPVDALGWPS